MKPVNAKGRISIKAADCHIVNIQQTNVQIKVQDRKSVV